MIVRKCEVIPFECVVRGYLSGQRLAGVPASPGPSAAPPCPAAWSSRTGSKPIFTPATKAESGHDENVSIEAMAEAIGQELAYDLAGPEPLDSTPRPPPTPSPGA